MPTSELSEALNPNFYQRRPSHHAPATPTSPQSLSTPVFIAPRPAAVNEHEVSQFVPHRSELEDAVNPMAIPQPTPLRTTNNVASASKPTRPPTEPMQMLKEMFASYAAYKEAFVAERKRRLEWEREHETKCVERMAEMESRILTLQSEIDTLRAFLNLTPFPPRAPFPAGMDANTAGSTSQSTAGPSCLQLSRDSVNISPSHVHSFDFGHHAPKHSGSLSATEGHSMHPEFVEGSSKSPDGLVSSESSGPKRKRPRPDLTDERHDLKVVIIDSPTDVKGQMKLRTRHDSRPQTIQTAMRAHVLRLMDLEHDKELPDSHAEGDALQDTSPVRFVWDKTAKRSRHNTKMKSRIVSDMLANKQLYPLVPDQEFNKSSLDAVFDQAFMTLRQKFRSQRNESSSVRADVIKTRRARKASRKKIKLQKRVSTRKDFDVFVNSKFDGAFQLDCMSSEESSDEGEEDNSSDEEKGPRTTILRVRYLSWRSSRLYKLYQLLDEKEEQDRALKPKRGVGRLDRRVGLPKEGNPLPPKGVARWMIGKKWLREMQVTNPTVLKQVEEAVVDYGGLDWSHLATLGDESDIEELGVALPPQPGGEPIFDGPQFAGWTPWYC
ncbi:hypothetical protein BD410DRAFT_779815 [Rickenella mellea]|uniref:Uncharacterized protein n=1 Tax=Rickenella mellea TaxID=50990 RepID=A0A4R5XFP2_9AGAM|nr:hypothetical protein BD410DRAFT_779815 [Rickenella mellea]